MKNNKTLSTQVAIIGAGPAGAVAAALLVKKGYKVVVVEQQKFPRFSIGESLLPQSMAFFEEAGMITEIEKDETFQFKNGAAFQFGDKYTSFDFTQKFTPGHGTTFQVRRCRFDKILADTSEALGAKILYRTAVEQVTESADDIQLIVTDLESGQQSTIKAEFVLDASGFGRVLPRLLELEQPSDFPVRESYFGHFEDGISAPEFDRNKILITINPKRRDIWYWLIPFADGKCSVGVVGRPEQLSTGKTNEQILWDAIQEAPELAALLRNAKSINKTQHIRGYAANVSQLYGDRFALLGNAAEFLDPVFSSGVTIAVKSAHLAVQSLDKQFNGETVDWDKEFAKPLKKGVETFRVFVNAWYEGSFQKVIFHEPTNHNVKSMICSILAGYAWDENNPYVAESERRLQVLSELCG